MYCPNCAKENSPEQKFCRACGFNLERTVESFLEQMPDFEGVSNSKISRFFETIGKIGFGGLIGAGLVGFVILLITIVNKFVLSGQIDKMIAGLILITLLISAVLGLAYVIYQEYAKEQKKGATAIRQNEIEAKDTAKLLEEKPFEPIPSVTENTTNLLFTELKTKTSGELK